MHDVEINFASVFPPDLKVSALNESVAGSVKSVFKAWDQRLNSSEVVLLDGLDALPFVVKWHLLLHTLLIYCCVGEVGSLI